MSDYDDYEDRDYDSDEKEPGMEDEYDAKQRTSSGDMLMNALRSTKFKDRNLSEQFRTLVEAVFYTLQKNLEIKFVTDSSLEDLFDTMGKVNKPGYKNSVAYVLGYYASSYGNRITKDSIDKVFRELPRINTYATQYPNFRVSKSDIIRYARLWLDLKKKE